MPPTIAQIEQRLIRRIGSKLAAVGLDGSTVDGTNPDLVDPIAAGLASLGITAASVAVVVDADLVAVEACAVPQLLDVATLRGLETVLGNWTDPDQMADTDNQQWLGKLYDSTEKNGRQAPGPGRAPVRLRARVALLRSPRPRVCRDARHRHREAGLMRPFSLRMFPHRASVRPLVESIGSSGGDSEDFGPPGPLLPCRVRFSADRQVWAAEAEASHTAAQVGFPADPAVKLGDHLVLGSRTLRVIGPVQARDADGVLFVVTCEIID